MKNIKIIAILICFVYVGLQNINAQSEEKKTVTEYKVQQSEVPESVKETLKNYSGYEISKKVTYTFEKNKNNVKEKVFTFKVEDGNYPYYLLINEKGKVLGIKSNERSE